VKNAAIKLYQKRKTEILEGKKLPEQLRGRVVRFAEIADDALAYCKANNQGQQFDGYRIGRLKDEFGNHAAEIPVEDLRRWFSEQEWQPGTHNRYKSTLSLMFRLAIENKKASTNPARLLKTKTRRQWPSPLLESNRPRQNRSGVPQAPCRRGVTIARGDLADYSAHMPEFEISLHTGMRPSEQYGLIWSRVDLVRKLITIPKSKNGNTRHIPLNSVAQAAFEELFARSSGQGRVFVNMQGEPLKGYKHWFDPAVRKAGVSFFTWYCLRHTFASRLVMAGVDLRTVAELMGHKTIQMTMRYAHLAPAHKLAAVEKLAAGWQANPPTDTKTDTSAFEQVSEVAKNAS